ncbi:MAG: HDOD domain-containing protein [Polyangia bacterium]
MGASRGGDRTGLNFFRPGADKCHVDGTALTATKLRGIAELWLDGAAPSAADLLAAKSLAAKMAVFEGIRPFSAVVQELVACVSRPDFTLDRVRELIEADPALAARIMRVANSAAYRTYEPCSTVSKAIVRIGATNVCDMAMAMSAITFFKDLGGVGQKIRDHSAGTAAVARELAFRLGRASAKVFLAGLLHDIGKLLLIQTGDADYAALAGESLAPNTVHLKEQAQWGYDHAILGGQVLLSWKLPEPIPQIVACHHQPKVAQARSALVGLSVDLLRVADEVDWLLQQRHDADSEHVRKLAQSPDGTRAGLNEKTLMELWDDLRTVRREALSVFK